MLALVRAGAIDGLSIGFRTVKARVDPKSRVRRLFALDLWEISIVTFPLLAGARVRAVKEDLGSPRPVPSGRTRAMRAWRDLPPSVSDAGARRGPRARRRVVFPMAGTCAAR